MEWHDNIGNDPYDEYREAPQGCGSVIVTGLCVAALVAFCLFCVGCKSVQVPTNTRDSIRTEYRHDSIYIFKHDSIFRDRWRKGDTTYIVTEKWMTQYKDRTKEVHDTIRTTELQYIKEAYVPAYYKNTSNGFWILLALLIALIGWKIIRKYIKLKTGI